MYVTIQNFGFNNTVKCNIADGAYDFSTRIHQFAEIQFIIEGKVELTTDGETEILGSGDVIVISPFRAHSFKTTAETKRWILIPSSNFISDFISSDISLINGEKCSFTASSGLSAFIRENVFDMGEDVLNLDNNDRAILKIKALAYAILNEYIEKVPRKALEIKNNALASILIYISQNFQSNLTRSSVGAALGYSPSYISHVIEALPNASFSSLLNSIRVEYAKKLLSEKRNTLIASKKVGGAATTNLTVTSFNMIDIALECGFGSERSFYRTFKLLTGCSPKAYISKRGSQG